MKKPAIITLTAAAAAASLAGIGYATVWYMDPFVRRDSTLRRLLASYPIRQEATP